MAEQEEYPRRYELLTQLKEKTKAGNVSWEIAAEPGSWLYSAPDSTVVLKRAQDSGPPIYTVVLRDRNQRVVDTFEAAPKQPFFSEIANLYTAVEDRKSATVDEVYGSILRSING